MRAASSVLTVLLCLALLAGCSAVPTATPIATPSPAPSASQTPTEPPRLVLPSEVMRYVGLRVDYDDLLEIAGIADGYPFYQESVEYDLSDGGRVRFELADDGWLSRVIARCQVEGEPLVEPSPDPSPVADSRFDRGTLALDLGDELQVSDLTAVFGSPTSDATVVQDVPDEGTFRFRTLAFSGVSFTLRQLADAADKTTWVLDGYAVTDPAFASARGLALGMSAEAVIRLFSGKVTLIELEGTMDGLDRVLVTMKERGYIGIDFTAERATLLHFFIPHGD